MNRNPGNERRRWLWSGIAALVFLGVTLLLLGSVGNKNAWTLALATIHLPAQILLYDVRAIDGEMIVVVVVLYLLELALVTTVIYGMTEVYFRLRSLFRSTK